MTEDHGGLIKALYEFFRPYMQYVLFLFLAFWGGTSSYLLENSAKGSDFSIAIMVSRWIVSGFAGVLMIMLCNYMAAPLALTGVAAGISGYMGGSAILLIQEFIIKKVRP